MNRSVLALGAVVVLGAASGLWLWLRDGDGAPAGSERTHGEGTSSEIATPAAREVPSTTVTPSLSDPAHVPAGSDGVREYKVGDVVVRDHRKGDHLPIDIPPNIHPPDERKVSSTLTADLAQKVRAVMSDCVASLPKEARGDKPRLEGQVTIAIRDKQVRVTAATMQLRDVVGASVEETKACIERRSVGITTATDEPDLTDYTINVSFAVL